MNRKFHARNRIVIIGAVANTRYHRTFSQSQFLWCFPEIKEGCTGNTITSIPVIVRITIKLHDLRLTVILLQLRSDQYLQKLSCECLFLCKQVVFYHLLGDRRTSLCDLSSMDDKGKSSTHRSFIINTLMGLERLVFCRYIGILQIHGDIRYFGIFIITRIYFPDYVIILIKEYGIAVLPECSFAHTGQGIIGGFCNMLID